MNVWGELYPYSARCTALNAVFLDEKTWIDELGYKYEETLQDAVAGEYYTAESRQAMIKKEPARLVVVYKMPQSAVVDWLRLPNVAIGSDTIAIFGEFPWDTPYEELPNSHPRGAGCLMPTGMSRSMRPPGLGVEGTIRDALGARRPRDGSSSPRTPTARPRRLSMSAEPRRRPRRR